MIIIFYGFIYIVKYIFSVFVFIDIEMNISSNREAKFLME